MISGVVQPAEQFRQPPPRGVWGMHFPIPYGKRQTWPGWASGGKGVIQGTIKIGTAFAFNCRAVLLSEATGARLDDVEISNGVYLFQRLAPGTYIVLIVDMSGQLRAKAIHTVVPAP